MLAQVIDNHPRLIRHMETPVPRAEVREWVVARRNDEIPAEVSLEYLGRLDRVALYDTGEAGKALFMDFHHILIDGASWRVMLDDLEALMAGRRPVPEADTLVLKFDAPLDFTPQEIDRMAERMDQLHERI